MARTQIRVDQDVRPQAGCGGGGHRRMAIDGICSRAIDGDGD